VLILNQLAWLLLISELELAELAVTMAALQQGLGSPAYSQLLHVPIGGKST